MSSSLPQNSTYQPDQSLAMPKQQHHHHAYAYQPNRRCLFVCPILVPWLQLPAWSYDGKVRKGKSLALNQKINYVPAFTYTPVYSHYPHYYLAPKPATEQPFVAMPAWPESLGRPNCVGICSIKSQYTAETGGATPRSDLNPLSCPFTPPVRAKSAWSHQATILDDEPWPEYSTTLSSGCRSPDILGDQYSTESSRVGTPEPIGCPYCGRKDLNDAGSDADSGVETESEDEGHFCVCDANFLANAYAADHDSFDLNSEKEELGSSSTDLIDFLCCHLDTHEWRTVARELGVDDVIIQSVDYDDFDSHREQMKLVFSLWAKSKKTHTHDAKRHQVACALQEIGRTDLVDLLEAQS